MTEATQSFFTKQHQSVCKNLKDFEGLLTEAVENGPNISLYSVITSLLMLNEYFSFRKESYTAR
jgi:hypothetical protein